MPESPPLGKLRQEDCKIEASLGYMVGLSNRKIHKGKRRGKEREGQKEGGLK